MMPALVPAPLTARDLIEVSTSLADLLERETAALLAMRMSEAVRFGNEKARLARLYRAISEELQAGRLVLLNLAETLRLELIAAAARLANAAAANERALRAGRAAVERVIAAIAGAIADQRSQVLAYGRPRFTPARIRSVPGVAVDRRL